jgi:serine/threonine-protein kinase RsbT
VTNWDDALFLALTKHVPSVLAELVVRRVKGSAGVPPSWSRIRDELRSSVRLFVEPSLHGVLLSALEQLCSHYDCNDADRPSATPARIAVITEMDVSHARLVAREMASTLRGSAFGVQRASTAVSELARNIAMYGGGGSIELTPSVGPPPALSIRAIDKGPGIGDLDAILGGSYRSRTGLGRGLSGVKRLATRFDVQTGRGGTRVEAEITL